MGIFSVIPILYKIIPIFDSIIISLLIILSIIIVVKLFKSRYLDYYNDIKGESVTFNKENDNNINFKDSKIRDDNGNLNRIVEKKDRAKVASIRKVAAGCREIDCL